ncbi:hypothetical protein EJ110_NYTH43157 [Nymphaea thermarum]|nr:hypothetical protein EJ110_NYTH43157 [Nymphaea thermarum]
MWTSILKEEIDKVQIKLDDYKKTWLKTGCTIMVDGWTDGKSRNLNNFLVNNLLGVVFFKSYDINGVKKTVDNLVKLTMEMIKKVVTDNAANYKAASMKLKEIDGFQHFFFGYLV